MKDVILLGEIVGLLYAINHDDDYRLSTLCGMYADDLKELLERYDGISENKDNGQMAKPTGSV